MTKPFKVESAQIKLLTDILLTKLLSELLHAEAQKFGIAQKAVEVALNIKVGDGGEDGRIKWEGDIEKTDFVPNRFTMFQNKAAEMAPSVYANEIMTKATRGNASKLKPKVEEVLDNSGAYIVFTTQELNKQKKDSRIDAIRQKLDEQGKGYALVCEIDIYDASQIASWVNQHVSAIVAVLSWVGSPIERGLKTYEIWSEHEYLSVIPFQSVDSRKEIISITKKELKKPKSCCRIVGLSGLGKTRTAHHLIGESEFLKNIVVYADANQTPAIDSLVSDWVSLGMQAIIVVDNCDYKLHESLVKEVKRSNSQLSLLSLDYSFESVSQDTLFFKLTVMEDDELLQLLDPIYKKDLPDLNRIVKFAQGFPQMAVLLAEARLSNDPNVRVGELSNDELANKLLWGHKGVENQDYLKILRACSLFDYFGIEKEFETQLEFIAEILKIDIDDVYACVQTYTHKDLIDRRGRMGQFVPKPLAIRLASQWWSNERVSKQNQLFDKIPDDMIGSFCNQIEKLDFHPEVKKLTKKLCGPQGNFGQAEVILSKKGSRLFRSFVIVNPEATSQSLYNTLETLDDNEILNITGDIRRNLVGSLELLCFHAICFEKSAWSLFKLAFNENETWGNNATAIFKQLFRVTLSGTEALPKLRFNTLNKILGLNSNLADMILIEALSESVDTYGGSRTVGAEHQGLKRPLKEWRAKIWQEIFDYWSDAFTMLLDIYERGDEQKQKVMRLIGQSIRGFVKSGRLDMLDHAIKKIVKKNGPFWPEALESIQNTFEYDMEGMPQQGIDALNGWKKLLNPQNASLEDKLKIIVINPPWTHIKADDGSLIDVAQKDAIEFAKSIYKDWASLIPYLELLLKKEQRQTQCFSFYLAKEIDIDDLLKLIDETLQKVIQIDNPNLSMLAGLFRGLFQKSPIIWQEKIDELTLKEATVTLYPEMITSGVIQADYLDTLIGLIQNENIEAKQLVLLSYGSVTKSLNPDEIASFCLSLAKLKEDCIWPAVNIIYMYYFGEKSNFDALKGYLKELLILVPLQKGEKSSARDMHQWKDLIEKLLCNQDELFALAIVNLIIEACNEELDYGDVLHYIKPVLFQIMQEYGNVAWPVFGDSIISARGVHLYRLQNLFDKSDKFSNQQPSILSVLPQKTVIKWCKTVPEKGPEFVASCVNIFDLIKDESDNDEIVELKVPSKLFVAILENFGNDEKVTRSLFSNIISRSWAGSLIPYLERDKVALKSLLEHSNQCVRSWVAECIEMLNSQIEQEKESESEEDFGIY